jgi:hypothetical protein
MSHIHYEEEQRFTEVRWVWIASVLVILSPLVIILLDEHHGQENTGLIILTTLLAWIPVGLVLFWARFNIKIDQTGLHYRFSPTLYKWRTIRADGILAVEVRDKRGFFERIACGYQRSIFRKTVFMNITGEKFVIIRSGDGQTLKIGSKNPEAMKLALKRLLHSNQETT